MKLKSLNIFSKEGERKMRTFTKKRGLFAAAATLLIVTVMLVTTWCSNDIGDEYTDNFTLPDGKGAVRLSFNDNVTRTIMPGTTTVSLGDFKLFKFIFEPNGSGTKLEHLVLVGTDSLTAAIVLDPGVYALTVIAYDTSVTSPDPTAASDWDAVAGNVVPVPVTILAGKIAHEKVELRLLTDGTVDGIFQYTLFNKTNNASYIDPDDIESAFMRFSPITMGGSSGIEINISDKFDNLPHTYNAIKTGIYYVEFEIEVESETVYFMHVVHIMNNNYTSAYEFKIGIDYFNAVYKFGSNELTFDDSDRSPVIKYSINNGTNFSVIPVPLSIPRGKTIIFKVEDPVGYVYDAGDFEWYCLSSTPTTSTTFTIDTTPAGYGEAVNPFSSARDYNLTVVGVVSNVKYATIVKFSVTP